MEIGLPHDPGGAGLLTSSRGDRHAKEHARLLAEAMKSCSFHGAFLGPPKRSVSLMGQRLAALSREKFASWLSAIAPPCHGKQDGPTLVLLPLLFWTCCGSCSSPVFALQIVLTRATFQAVRRLRRP